MMRYYVETRQGRLQRIVVNPTRPLTRADLALAFNAFRTIFAQRNFLSANELP